MGKQPNAVSTPHRQPQQRLTLPLPQCDIGPAWCYPTTCQTHFSGPGSSCASLSYSTYSNSSTSSTLPSATPPPPSYTSAIPNIDVCGDAVGRSVSCPGAGVPPAGSHLPGYYYRCCSIGGHCGPKNSLESQDLYCSAETCQVGFGDCATDRTAPPLPSGPAKVVGMGQTCGPIVNAKCGDGLCCSGSNYCGRFDPTSPLVCCVRERERERERKKDSPLSTGYQITHEAKHRLLPNIGNTIDYCGPANWCQPLWGQCN